MSEAVNSTFSSFAKACDVINKVSPDELIASNGVFMWLSEGALSILTLHQKLEKNIIPFLVGKYRLNPGAIVFMSTYFDLYDIDLSGDEIKFTFSGDIHDKFKDMSSENIETYMKLLEMDNGKYVLRFEKIDEYDATYQNIINILKSIHENGDFDRSVVINDLDKNELMKGDKPITVNRDGFFVRIAKSVFQTINTNDSISLRLTPYKHTDAIFLCTATVSKDQFQIINLLNALNIKGV